MCLPLVAGWLIGHEPPIWLCSYIPGSVTASGPWTAALCRIHTLTWDQFSSLWWRQLSQVQGQFLDSQKHWWKDIYQLWGLGELRWPRLSVFITKSTYKSLFFNQNMLQWRSCGKKTLFYVDNFKWAWCRNVCSLLKSFLHSSKPHSYLGSNIQRHTLAHPPTHTHTHEQHLITHTTSTAAQQRSVCPQHKRQRKSTESISHLIHQEFISPKKLLSFF